MCSKSTPKHFCFFFNFQKKFFRSENVIAGINGQYSAILATIVLQIAIYEIFKQLNTPPDCIVASSYGKFAKAYTDGVLTLQQALKGAYNAAKYFLNGKATKFTLWNDLKNDLNSSDEGTREICL